MLNGQDYMYQTNRYYHELWLKEKGEGIYEDYMIPNDTACLFFWLQNLRDCILLLVDISW